MRKFYGLIPKTLPKEKLKPFCKRCNCMLPNFKAIYCPICSDMNRQEALLINLTAKRLAAHTAKIKNEY